MKIGTLLNYSGDYVAAIDEVVALEKAGLDAVWVPEAYSFDAVTVMGFLAARTQTVEIGSGILPVYTRTPTLLAMTAAGLDALTGGRAVLGLGASGPQVIEGFHGVEYDAPLGRTRETIEICRQVWRREKVDFHGKYYDVPLPEGQGTGLGKSLKLINHPVRSDIPILVASLGDKNVEMTAELANQWLPIWFWPERSRQVWGDALDAGMEKVVLIVRSDIEADEDLSGVDAHDLAIVPLFIVEAPDGADGITGGDVPDPAAVYTALPKIAGAGQDGFPIGRHLQVIYCQGLRRGILLQND